MSTGSDIRRIVRIIGSEGASPKCTHESVNVISVKNHGNDPHNSVKEFVQVTASQYNAQPVGDRSQIDTVLATAATDPLKRTIYVNGYLGPS